MSAWRIEYIKAAEKDLLALDRSQQLQVLKAIEKISVNPLSINAGGLDLPKIYRRFSRKVKVVYSPSTLCTCIFPPSISITAFAMDNPKP